MRVGIRLLGGFSVTLGEEERPGDVWRRRHAAGLVKLLALAPGRRMHRERVMDTLWPDLPTDAAAPRLHKAAHYARRTLGEDHHPLVVLQDDLVMLFPSDAVTVDAVEFETRATRALATNSAALSSAAADLYTGPLLPNDLYDPWTGDIRQSLHRLYLDVLRKAGRWDDVLRELPADEEAHLALAQQRFDAGDVHAALRQLERLDRTLRTELGTAPSPRVEQLRQRLHASASHAPAEAPPRRPPQRLVGRRDAGDVVRSHLSRARDGRGGTLLVSGPPGVGKSSVLDMSLALAGKQSFRAGRGTASAVEGAWPYAPVLEALSDLCRHHPALLDGLDDVYRDELERALSGRADRWTGETSHQRLFVAAAELVRLAAAGHGLILVVDDVHESDEASLRLLHYLARCAVDEPVVLVLAYRSPLNHALAQVESSLLARRLGTRLELAPLDHQASRRLLDHRFPDLDDETAEQICAASGGLPFTVLELAQASVDGSGRGMGAAVPVAVRHTLQRVAVLGMEFDTDELVAVAEGDEAEAYAHLDAAVAAHVVEPAESGYRFRHTLLREAFLEDLPPHAYRAVRREVARRLAATEASPWRIAHHLLAAGEPAQAVRFVLPAVETTAALGAYRDALTLVDAVRSHASGAERAHLLARRGDLLMALGEPGAVTAYLDAVALTTGTEHRLVRARLARAACFRGDVDTAAAALEGLAPEGDAADGPILLARGNLAYFSGDVDAAWNAASQARRMLLAPDDPWQYVDLVALQGLIAHQRGEWFERLRLELRQTQDAPDLATALFDAHLCVAEYLLYGRIPYAEVVELAEALRRRAQRFGALRGVAFATALVGEAALLRGDLDRAERELQEAVDLHRDIAASAGEAHCLQRLAEVRLARGDRAEAMRLLQQALPLARWSMIAMHLLQRIYGSMITAAGDPETARAVVDRAEATMGETDHCPFCAVMLAVPASIACADVGDVTAARAHLAVAEESAARWEGQAWQAAVLEARAHVHRAQGDLDGAERMLTEAARLFAEAEQPLDAARCATFSRPPPPLVPTQRDEAHRALPLTPSP